MRLQTYCNFVSSGYSQLLIASAEVMNSGGLCATHAYKEQATQSHYSFWGVSHSCLISQA